jgi:hypothetical protein
MSTNLPNIRPPRRKWLRRFIAKYIRYVEVIGYGFVVLAATAIVTCWFVQVDDVAKADGTPVIKPRTEIVNDNENDVVVVKVHVENRDPVQKGQLLVSVCSNPKWVERYKALSQWVEAAKSLAKSGDSSLLVSDAEQRLAAWKEQILNAHLDKKPAPIGGKVDGVKDIEWKVIPKGKDIARVLDFSDLRITVKLIGENVPKARSEQKEGNGQKKRIGQKATIEILPDYGSLPLYVRGEAAWSRFDKQHVQFNNLLDDQDKEAIKAKLQGEDKTLTLRDDIPLTFSDVLALWVDSTLIPQTASNGEKSTMAAIPVETLEHLNPLRGTLIDGKHTGKMELRDVPEDVKEELRQRLLQKLKDKMVSTDDQPFRVKDIQDIRPAIQLKIETLDPTESEEELERKLQNAHVAAKIERFYEGTVQIDNPPLELRMMVEKLQLQDKPVDVKTNVWVAVAKRRVAMLLFRR